MSGQNPYNQPPNFGADSQNPYSNPWGSSESQNPSQAYNPPPQGHDQNSFNNQQTTNPFNAPPPQNHAQAYDAPPNLPPRRTDTDRALPQGQDRSHQVEVMQSYEMSRPETEDEQNQKILEREFPRIDGSLIAAIYGDSGSLSATREMLQELSRGEEGR